MFRLAVVKAAADMLFPSSFFMGGFIFALLQSLTVLGDEGTALSLPPLEFYLCANAV